MRASHLRDDDHGGADKVGIHNPALLRYFETREQIFLELTAEAWLGWAQALHAGLDAAAPGSADLVAEAVARSFGERRLLCDLIPHTGLNLERHVSVGRRYKLTSLGVMSDATDVVHRVLPDLTTDECRDFVTTMATLAGSLWQIANPRPRWPSCTKRTRNWPRPASTSSPGCGERPRYCWPG